MRAISAICILLALIHSEGDHVRRLDRYLKSSRKVEVAKKPMPDQAFNSLLMDEKFARAVLEVCSFKAGTTESISAVRRYLKLNLRKVEIATGDIGVKAFTLSYRSTGYRRFLEFAIAIPTDGAYAEGRELFFTKATLAVEDQSTGADAQLLRFVRTVRDRSMPEWQEDVMKYLAGQPKTKLVKSLQIAWKQSS